MTLSLEQALEAIDKALADSRLPSETLPTRDAGGQTLAADIASRLDLPPFDKSAMDGYALPPGEEEVYEVLETVFAGQTATTALRPGAAIKIMTGAPVPEGAERVVMVEKTEEQEGKVWVMERGDKTNICLQGEDMRCGDPVLATGKELTPVAIANLVACGVAEVEVRRRPRVVVISTGDEIIDSPDDLGPGRIMDSNGPMLAALARQRGMLSSDVARVSDTLEARTSAIGGALAQADMVLLTGGVSAGDRDFVGSAFTELGMTTHFSKVAIKPGKPVTCATGPGGKLAFGLPGNPVAAYLTFHLFVLHAAAILSGREPRRRSFKFPLAGPYARKRATRLQFVPGRLDENGRVAVLPCHGTAHLMALLEADGLFSVPPGVSELAADDEVEFLPHGNCCQ